MCYDSCFKKFLFNKPFILIINYNFIISDQSAEQLEDVTRIPASVCLRVDWSDIYIYYSNFYMKLIYKLIKNKIFRFLIKMLSDIAFFNKFLDKNSRLYAVFATHVAGFLSFIWQLSSSFFKSV